MAASTHMPLPLAHSPVDYIRDVPSSWSAGLILRYQVVPVLSQYCEDVCGGLNNSPSPN